jgi:predicted MPP superfamily phosphohydrolase
MERVPLASPRRIRLSDQQAAEAWPVGGPSREHSVCESRRPIVRERLSRPSPAREHLRRWFDPRGWFRTLERAGSHHLSRTIYPHLPGLTLPYGRILEKHLTLSEATIGLKGLPPEFDGLRMLVVSDIHAGPFVSPEVLDRTIARLVELRPDVIVLPGDLLTARIEEWDAHRRAFERFRAPLGTFAVMGNHDHYTGEIDRVIERVEQAGIRVLDNASCTLHCRGATLSLAGVDDLLMGAPDLDAAPAGTEEPVILVSHNPALLFDAARRGVALMLSGHTHAGQIRLPGLPVLVRQSRYRLDEGRFTVGETQAIVSRGLGAVGVPLRLHCHPEALWLTLSQSAPGR